LLFEKIKALSNKRRFLIIEKTQNKELPITELGKVINLSYTKCADYVTFLEKKGLVSKSKRGRLTFVKSRVKIKGKALFFE
jgi:predicted transcriptional regulator